jgi:hypothetical protein
MLVRFVLVQWLVVGCAVGGGLVTGRLGQSQIEGVPLFVDRDRVVDEELQGLSSGDLRA